MNVIGFKANADREAILRTVRESNESFERKLCDVAETFAADPELRFFGLTGPTCSGKTTAARMLTRCLEQKGKTVQVISIDDFYYEKSYLWSMFERDGGRQLDYDSEKTIDLSPILRNMRR